MQEPEAYTPLDYEKVKSDMANAANRRKSLLLQAIRWVNCSSLFIPPATKLGGVYWNHHVRLSVRLSSAFGFPAHNCFPITPIIMKLHMQTPHESRMCPIDFEIKRSKVKVTMHKLLKMVSGV